MVKIASYTDQGGREYNEDASRLVQKAEDRLCLMVADGLGGHGGGEQASQAAVKAVAESWSGRADAKELEALLQAANRDVLALQSILCAMKTTAVVLALDGAKAAWAHVGDSRLYHFQDGRMVSHTKDHSVAQMNVMLGEITEDQIRFHEDRSRVLRALGQDGELKVSLQEKTLGPGRHIFLLCTDGFWEFVLEEEMEEDLKTAKDPAQWLALMRARLMARAPKDNDNNTAATVWLTI